MNMPLDNTVVKTYNKLSKLPLGAVRAKGWLKEQLLRNKEGMGGNLDLLEPEMIANPFIDYTFFKYMPWENGSEADPTFAAGWSSEISGTYWTGLVQLAFTLNDPELIQKAETWVNGVLKHQEPDGYLGGYPETTDRNADYNPWGSTWCYRAMLAYYEATGRKEVLDAVYRGLLWFCENWKDHKTDYAGSVIIEPMIVVYAYTADTRLLDFCCDWLDWLEEHTPWQNKVSQYLSEELPYTSMHTSAYGENVKHPAIVYCANGDRRLLEASVHGMKKALARIVQTTGGPSSCAEFLSPKGAANETEYCNFATYTSSYSWLALATGQACWGDEIERCLFNGAQGARKKDERAIAYFTAPNQLYATRKSTFFGSYTDMSAYAPCYSIACCPAQSVRIIPEFVRGMCMRNQDGEMVLFCYGPASVETDDLAFEMDTLYPFRETITLKVTRGENARIHLRIPAWCKNPSVQVNGKTAALTLSDEGFAVLETRISTADVVMIHFPMEISVVQIDDSASASKYPVSIERGPLVYALPIATNWSEYPGDPVTPLPEGWSWYEARPDLSFCSSSNPVIAYQSAPWSKAIDPQISAEQIRVVEHDVSGYVWENPPVTLELPLYQAPHAYLCVAQRTFESWEAPLLVTGAPQLCTLVPHGCTNLRVTYLPRAKK